MGMLDCDLMAQLQKLGFIKYQLTPFGLRVQVSNTAWHEFLGYEEETFAAYLDSDHGHRACQSLADVRQYCRVPATGGLASRAKIQQALDGINWLTNQQIAVSL